MGLKFIQMRHYDLQVQNLTRNNWVVENGWEANTSWKRMVGLLKHTHLNRGQGLWIPSCWWIHSFGMKFVFDAVFLNRRHEVVRVICSIHQNRIVSPVWKASSVVEIPSGQAERCGVQLGDQIHLVHFQK